MRAARPLATAVAVLCLAVHPAFAQLTTADIVGRVTDTTGAVLPGVTVTVEHAGTHETRVVPTNKVKGRSNSACTSWVAVSGVRPPTATPPIVTPSGMVAGCTSSAAAGADATRSPARKRRQRRFTLSIR